jgi:hypothetical protein
MNKKNLNFEHFCDFLYGNGTVEGFLFKAQLLKCPVDAALEMATIFNDVNMKITWKNFVGAISQVMHKGNRVNEDFGNKDEKMNRARIHKTISIKEFHNILNRMRQKNLNHPAPQTQQGDYQQIMKAFKESLISKADRRKLITKKESVQSIKHNAQSHSSLDLHSIVPGSKPLKVPDSRHQS